MSRTYDQCVADGAYEQVSAGEVCSIDYAKTLGIYDATNYFTDSYKNTKTFNKTKDHAESRGDEICSQRFNEDPNATIAYPACSLQAGVGMVRKPGKPELCETYGCPTGFKFERGACTKPLQDAILTQLAFCDERWYDWYMIPNFHLGNGYVGDSNHPGTCYRPCQPGFVPNVVMDPGSGASMDFVSTEKKNECIPKTEFFFGKYDGTSDFCPLAWIHRIGKMPSDIVNTLTDKYQNVLKENKGVANEEWNTLDRDKEVLARNLVKNASVYLEPVEVPTGDLLEACNNLRTQERLQEAYDICRAIADDEDAFSRRMESELEQDSDVVANKVTLLKQACNAVFCSMNDDSIAMIGQEPICFEGVGQVKETTLEDEQENPTMEPPSINGGKSFISQSFRTAKRIIIFFLIIVIIAIIIFLLWKLLKWLWYHGGEGVYIALQKLRGKFVVSSSANARNLSDVSNQLLERAKDSLDKK